MELMYTSLWFRIKNITSLEKYHMLEMFFKSWVDGICDNEVYYTFDLSNVFNSEICRVDFNNSSDALALILIGIPLDLKKYIEIIDYH